MARDRSTDESKPVRRKRGRGADPEQTKRVLIDAAVRSLVEDGYRGTTARAIAARADCNQAAIYYHFGGIEPLLVAGLKLSSEERLARYQRALTDDLSLNDLVGQIEKLYLDDRSCGYLGLLTELVGGITASPELREGIEEATTPWLSFIEERIREASKSVSFGPLLPSADLADLVFSIVIGMELRNKVDGNDERSTRLFRLASLAAGLVPAKE